MQKLFTKKNILIASCVVLLTLVICFIYLYTSALDKYSDFAYKNNFKDIVSIMFHDESAPYNEFKTRENKLTNHDYTQYENCKVKSQLQIALSSKEEVLIVDSIYVYMDGSQSGTVNVTLGDISRIYYIFKSKYDSENLTYVNYQGKWYAYTPKNEPPTVEEVVNCLIKYTTSFDWNTYPKLIEGDGIKIDANKPNGASSISCEIYANDKINFNYSSTDAITKNSFLSVAVKAEDKIIKTYNRTRGHLHFTYEIYDIGSVTESEIMKPNAEIEYVRDVYDLFSKYESWVSNHTNKKP